MPTVYSDTELRMLVQAALLMNGTAFLIMQGIRIRWPVGLLRGCKIWRHFDPVTDSVVSGMCNKSHCSKFMTHLTELLLVDIL